MHNINRDYDSALGKKAFSRKEQRESFWLYTYGKLLFLAWLFAQTIFCSFVWHSFSQAILEQKCKHFSPLNKRFSMSNTPLSSVHSVQKNPINCLVHNATQLVWISTFSRENSSFCISVIYIVRVQTAAFINASGMKKHLCVIWKKIVEVFIKIALELRSLFWLGKWFESKQEECGSHCEPKATLTLACIMAAKVTFQRSLCCKWFSNDTNSNRLNCKLGSYGR